MGAEIVADPHPLPPFNPLSLHIGWAQTRIMWCSSWGRCGPLPLFLSPSFRALHKQSLSASVPGSHPAQAHAIHPSIHPPPLSLVMMASTKECKARHIHSTCSLVPKVHHRACCEAVPTFQRLQPRKHPPPKRRQTPTNTLRMPWVLSRGQDDQTTSLGLSFLGDGCILNFLVSL